MKFSALILALILALSSAAWARPEKWKKTPNPVTDDTLARARAQAASKALAEYEAMERARALAGTKAWADYKAMEEARAKAKAAKSAPKLPH